MSSSTSSAPQPSPLPGPQSGPQPGHSASQPNRGTTVPGTNDGSYAPKAQNVPGLAAHLTENTATQRLKVAMALVDTGIRRRDETEFTEPVSLTVIKAELRQMVPGVEDEVFEDAWNGIAAKAEDIATMERLWDTSERTGDWDGFDDYAWDACVEKDDFLIEDEDHGGSFVDVHDYAGTILADYEARMHEELNTLVNRPGAAQQIAGAVGSHDAGVA